MTSPPAKKWPIADKLVLMRRLMATTYLMPCDKLVAITLLIRKNVDTGKCNPPLEMIGKDIGKSARTVTRSLERLAVSKVMSVTRRRGTTQYDFLRSWRDTPEAAAAVAKLTEHPPSTARHRDASGRYAIHGEAHPPSMAALGTPSMADLKSKGEKKIENKKPPGRRQDPVSAREASDDGGGNGLGAEGLLKREYQARAQRSGP